MNTSFTHVSRTSAAGTLMAAALLAGLPAAAGPSGTYVHKLTSKAPAAVRCAEAAGRTGGAVGSGIAACTEALAEIAPDSGLRAASLTNRAVLYRRAGAPEEAMVDCEAALKLTPADPRTAITCSAVRITAGQPQAALDLLEQAPLPAAGLRHKYFHNLALAHHDLGEYPLAYHYLEKTLEEEPGFAPALELKAHYRVSGD